MKTIEGAAVKPGGYDASWDAMSHKGMPRIESMFLVMHTLVGRSDGSND